MCVQATYIHVRARIYMCVHVYVYTYVRTYRPPNNQKAAYTCTASTSAPPHAHPCIWPRHAYRNSSMQRKHGTFAGLLHRGDLINDTRSDTATRHDHDQASTRTHTWQHMIRHHMHMYSMHTYACTAVRLCGERMTRCAQAYGESAHVTCTAQLQRSRDVHSA